MITRILAIALCVLLTACASVTPASTADGLIDQIKAAGLEVDQPAPLAAQAGIVKAIKFYTPSLCDGCSSIAFIMESEGKAGELLAQFDLAGQASDSLKFHVYHRGRAILRMGGLIDKGQADKYAAAVGLN